MSENFLKKTLASLLAAALCLQAAAVELTDAHERLAEILSQMLTGNEGATAFRSLDIPMGGRSEAMCQAFTAICDDIGFIENNPAGSAVLPDTEISVLHNSWIADSALDSLAFATRRKRLGLGAALRCFYVPFTEYSQVGDRLSSGYYSETLATFNAAYNFLSGYKFKGVAVGGNVKIGYRGVPDYAGRSSTTARKNSGLSQSGLALMADVGVLLRFDAAKKFASRDPNLTVGLSIMNVGAGWTKLGTSRVELDDPMPTKVNLGVSLRPASSMSLSIDGSMPLNLADLSKIVLPSFSIGYSVDFTSFLGLLCGVGVRGANPRFSLGLEAQIRRLKINANYTLDFASSLNPFNHFSVGLKVVLDDYEKRQRMLQIDALYNEGLRFFNERNFEDARACWEEALLIDPAYDPAIEGIRAIERTTRNYGGIEGAENVLDKYQ